MRKGVAVALRARGHGVTTPIPTGLGERIHLLSADLDLATHVENIVNHMEMEGLGGIHYTYVTLGGDFPAAVPPFYEQTKADPRSETRKLDDGHMMMLAVVQKDRRPAGRGEVTSFMA